MNQHLKIKMRDTNSVVESFASKLILWIMVKSKGKQFMNRSMSKMYRNIVQLYRLQKN